MADRFLVVWFDDGTPIVTSHPTSAEAFQRAKELFQQHGQDIKKTNTREFLALQA